MKGWSFVLASSAALAICIGMEAGGYAWIESVGSYALIAAAIFVCLLSWWIGCFSQRSTAFVGFYSGIGFATVFLGVNYYFLMWFRLDVLRDFSDAPWRDFGNFYATATVILSALCGMLGMVAAALGPTQE